MPASVETRRKRKSLPETDPRPSKRRGPRLSSPQNTSPRFRQQLLTTLWENRVKAKTKSANRSIRRTSKNDSSFSTPNVRINSSPPSSHEKENPAMRLKRYFRETPVKSPPHSPSPRRAPSSLSSLELESTPAFSSPISSTNESGQTSFSSVPKRRRKREESRRPRRSRKEDKREKRVRRTRSIKVDKEDANSPIKTRFIQKTTDISRTSCALCNNGDGAMLVCHNCQLNYHPMRCLLYLKKVANSLLSRNDWLCPQCVTCVKCGAFIDDPSNVECSKCGRVWHGHCSPSEAAYSKEWSCKDCGGSSQSRIISSPKTYHRGPLSPAATPNGKLPFSLSSASLTSSSSPSVRSPKTSKDGNKTTSQMSSLIKGLMESPPRNESSDNKKLTGVSKHSGNKSKTKLIRQLEMLLKHSDTSPIKRIKTDSLDRFNHVLQKYKRISEGKRQDEDSEQWVHMGARDQMKVIYPSTAYSNEIQGALNIYVCIYCLMTSSDQNDYRIHMEFCNVFHPPGNEIYRDRQLSFFEVDGQHEQGYCRRLCKLAKLFLSSKMLYHDVEDFWFYILTETTEHGCEIVGYFSKEKKPSKDYNLSCLLAMPYAQKKGYGRLIIDMSYELSRIERRIGGPEHPLSDLGLKTYIGYWRASILAYLRSLHNLNQVSLTEMSLATRIKIDEIVAQLLRDRLIVYQDGQYYIRHGERALRFPLCATRRRTIKRELIIWEPEEDISELDSTKINGYISREN